MACRCRWRETVEDGYGIGIDCHKADIVKVFEAEATPAASDWTPDDLLFIRIQRKVASDTYDGDFFLASAELVYPSTN